MQALLHLTQVEANIDLKRQGTSYLEGPLQDWRMSGASTMTPGNDRLIRELKEKSTERAWT